MEIHHTKHHQTYVDNANKAEAAIAAASSLEGEAKVKETLAAAALLKFAGGGHVNHSLFWENMAPTSEGGGERPSEGSALGQQLARDFGSIDAFEARLTAAAIGVQGSGWAWLAYDKVDDRLVTLTKPNQDPVEGQLAPLLGIDVWEHAYWYQYTSNRAEYLKNFWKVANYQVVAERLAAAKAQ
jgi:Fe-Mn family superoxide dismutase